MDEERRMTWKESVACFFCNLKCPSLRESDVSLTVQPVLKAENRYEEFYSVGQPKWLN